MAKIPPPWAQFEDRISKQCVRYFRDGVAKIHKADPPTKVIGRGRILFLENPFLDYIGSITESGQFITFEAKRTERPYLPLGGKGRGLIQKQINDLLAWRAAGAITGVLWEYDAVVRWVPGAFVEAARLGVESKSLKLDDGIEVPQIPFPDFLPVALEG